MNHFCTIKLMITKEPDPKWRKLERRNEFMVLL